MIVLNAFLEQTACWVLRMERLFWRKKNAPEIAKLKEEREKHIEKISSLQARIKKIDAAIVEIENTDIIGMVREQGLSPDMLMELLKGMKKEPLPAATFERTEDEIIEE